MSSAVYEKAFVAKKPPFTLQNDKPTDAQRRGLRYEKKALRWLKKNHDRSGVLTQPWFNYIEEGGSRWRTCQPDMVLFDEQTARAVVVEVKLRHTLSAEEKLYEQYLPLAEYLFPAWTFTGCEVVQFYDPWLKGREQRILLSPWEVDPGEYGAVIYDPRFDG